jgi:hypothetical protein
MKNKPQKRIRARSGGDTLFKREIVDASVAWGPVESIDDIAPGIQWLTTSRHGGFRLTPDANAKIPTNLRQHAGLYEEDCEWCKVVLWFPEHFAKELCRDALHSFRMNFPEAGAEFGPERETVIESSQCGESWRPFVAPAGLPVSRPAKPE